MPLQPFQKSVEKLVHGVLIATLLSIIIDSPALARTLAIGTGFCRIFAISTKKRFALSVPYKVICGQP